MALTTTINTEIKQAMLAKDAGKLKALRAIKSALLLEQTKGGKSEITEEDEIKMLQKLVKQRKDSATIYEQNGREEAAKEELEEAKYIEAYLPKQLSAEELESVIKGLISQVGATSMADMGKVMGLASKQLAGKADGRAIADTVKKMLAV
ncbi:MAG: GatB/YqeY domain-containing protein [Flavobacteriaceae bacterium]|nr:GatB/YqeY domain-containing protein [Flavobacteriaceae bacterium]